MEKKMSGDLSDDNQMTERLNGPVVTIATHIHRNPR